MEGATYRAPLKETLLDAEMEVHLSAGQILKGAEYICTPNLSHALMHNFVFVNHIKYTVNKTILRSMFLVTKGIIVSTHKKPHYFFSFLLLDLRRSIQDETVTI